MRSQFSSPYRSLRNSLNFWRGWYQQSTCEATCSDCMNLNGVKHCQVKFEDKLKAQGLISLVCDLSGLPDISVDAVAPGSKIDMEFIQHLDKFARFTLVSDKEWPGVLVGMADKFLPGLKVKLFSDRQLAAHLNHWLHQYN